MTIGLAGPYSQLAYMLLVGAMGEKYGVVDVRYFFGGKDLKNYVIAMLAWTLGYFFWYAIWFHEDPNSDFVLYVRQ